jgi:hypothetical protein
LPLDELILTLPCHTSPAFARNGPCLLLNQLLSGTKEIPSNLSQALGTYGYGQTGSKSRNNISYPGDYVNDF